MMIEQLPFRFLKAPYLEAPPSLARKSGRASTRKTPFNPKLTVPVELRTRRTSQSPPFHHLPRSLCAVTVLNQALSLD